MNFTDVPGHDDLKASLRHMTDSGSIPHAILLSGREGLGKMMLARAFAQYVHCENQTAGEPCGRCRSCRMHEELMHPDVKFIYPIVKSEKLKRRVSADVLPLWQQMLRESPLMPSEEWLEIIEAGNSQPAIYVDEAEEIIRADAYPPFTSTNRFFIIWLPERMRVETANKLLKVIEEPNPGTIFLLVSDNELGLLPTIYSRTQRFHVGNLSPVELASYLERRFSMPDYLAARFASIAEGNLLAADRLGASSGENEVFRQMYIEIMRAAYGKRPASLRRLSESVAALGREKIRRFLNYMTRMARENFIYNLRMPQLSALTPEEEDFSKRFSPFINHANVERIIEETDRARADIERNANAKIVLFDFFLLLIPLLHKK